MAVTKHWWEYKQATRIKRNGKERRRGGMWFATQYKQRGEFVNGEFVSFDEKVLSAYAHGFNSKRAAKRFTKALDRHYVDLSRAYQTYKDLSP